MHIPIHSSNPTPTAPDRSGNPGSTDGLYRTEIRYDAEMRMEALYINDVLMGYSDTKTNADRALTILVGDLMTEAAELAAIKASRGFAAYEASLEEPPALFYQMK